jgi:hypothetical protein
MCVTEDTQQYRIEPWCTVSVHGEVPCMAEWCTPGVHGNVVCGAYVTGPVTSPPPLKNDVKEGDIISVVNTS